MWFSVVEVGYTTYFEFSNLNNNNSNINEIHKKESLISDSNIGLHPPKLTKCIWSGNNFVGEWVNLCDGVPLYNLPVQGRTVHFLTGNERPYPHPHHDVVRHCHGLICKYCIQSDILFIRNQIQKILSINSNCKAKNTKFTIVTNSYHSSLILFLSYSNLTFLSCLLSIKVILTKLTYFLLCQLTLLYPPISLYYLTYVRCSLIHLPKLSSLCDTFSIHVQQQTQYSVVMMFGL